MIPLLRYCDKTQEYVIPEKCDNCIFKTKDTNKCWYLLWVPGLIQDTDRNEETGNA